MSQPELKEVKQGMYEILSSIRKEPSLSIGEPELIRTGCFITGYHAAVKSGDVSDPEEQDFRRNFHEWIAERLGFAHSGPGWYNMIRAQCSSEREAFDRFYELLDEFKARVA